MIPIGEREVSYSLPSKVCASCGKEGKVKFKEIECTYSKNYVVARKIKTIKIRVPLCTKCSIKYKEAESNAGIFGYGTIFLGIFISFIIGSTNNNLTVAWALGILSLIVGSIIISTIGPSKLVDYDGKTITFKNKEFHQKFVALNSHGIDRYIQMSAGVSKIYGDPRKHDLVDSDSLLLQSGLTQMVMADIALGIDKNSTVSTLIKNGMTGPEANTYVGNLTDILMKMPDEQRETIQRNIRQRLEILDEALSNGLKEDSLVQILMQSEGFTKQQAEGIVSYCKNIYRIQKL